MRTLKEELDAWNKGTIRFRTTFTGQDGSRHVEQLTRSEFDAKMKRIETFRSIRDNLELSQPGFANLLHSTPAAVRQWEQGRRTIPDPILLLAQLAQDPKVRMRMESFSVAEPEPEYGAESGKSKKRAKKA
jgi:DNA-binding transcriptional regulator YiaG